MWDVKLELWKEGSGPSPNGLKHAALASQEVSQVAMGGVFHDDQQSGSICACAQKVDNVLMLSYVDKNLELWSEVSVLLFSGIGWNFEVNRQKKSLVIRRLFIMVNHPTASSPQPNIIITIENVTSKCNDFSRDSKTCVPIILELNTSYQQFEARNVSKLRIASIYGPNERQEDHELKWEKTSRRN